MIIAMSIGFVSGIIGALCSSLLQLLSRAVLYFPALAHWSWLAPIMGVAVITPFKGPRRQGLADLAESYHFGTFIQRPSVWGCRGWLSLLGAALGGIFGVEGAIFEYSYALMPFLWRSYPLFIEEKRSLVICILSSSISVSFGAPFSGALLALELIHAQEPRVRIRTVLSALTACGIAALLRMTVLSGVFGDAFEGRSSALSILFTGVRPADLEIKQWILLCCGAIGVGIVSGLFSIVNAQLIAKASGFFHAIAKHRVHLRLLMTAALMGLCMGVVPESFNEQGHLWDHLIWQRLSSAEAAVIFFSGWSVFTIASAGWGSTGLFSPLLAFGALIGYVASSLINTSWTVPLAVSGAAAALSGCLSVPIAASALVLELSRDPSLWLLSTLAIASCALSHRFLRQSRSLLPLLLENNDIRIVRGQLASLLNGIKVQETMVKDVVIIREDANLHELRTAISASRHAFIGVISQKGIYRGLLALEHLFLINARKIALIEKVIEIGDLIDAFAPTIAAEDNLEKALGLFESYPCLAVVDEQRRLKGLVLEELVSERYKLEITRRGISQWTSKIAHHDAQRTQR